MAYEAIERKLVSPAGLTGKNPDSRAFSRRTKRSVHLALPQRHVRLIQPNPAGPRYHSGLEYAHCNLADLVVLLPLESLRRWSTEDWRRVRMSGDECAGD